MVGKIKSLLSAIEANSQEEPMVLVVVFLVGILILSFLAVSVIVIITFLGILTIPTLCILGSLCMVLLEGYEEESE
jgi:hypothetical protein